MTARKVTKTQLSSHERSTAHTNGTLSLHRYVPLGVTISADITIKARIFGAPAFALAHEKTCSHGLQSSPYLPLGYIVLTPYSSQKWESSARTNTHTHKKKSWSMPFLPASFQPAAYHILAASGASRIQADAAATCSCSQHGCIRQVHTTAKVRAIEQRCDSFSWTATAVCMPKTGCRVPGLESQMFAKVSGRPSYWHALRYCHPPRLLDTGREKNCRTLFVGVLL